MAGQYGLKRGKRYMLNYISRYLEISTNEDLEKLTH